MGGPFPAPGTSTPIVWNDLVFCAHSDSRRAPETRLMKHPRPGEVHGALALDHTYGKTPMGANSTHPGSVTRAPQGPTDLPQRPGHRRFRFWSSLIPTYLPPSP